MSGRTHGRMLAHVHEARTAPKGRDLSNGSQPKDYGQLPSPRTFGRGKSIRNMLSSLLVICAIAGLWLRSGADPFPARIRRTDVNDFIDREAEIAIEGILANIGAKGSRAHDAAPGIVAASPSKSDPDYWYTWTRDAALTLKVLVERFIEGDDSLQPVIEDYLVAQARLQDVPNLSGDPESGGLGEPKFNVNLTAFSGAWGRPQRDGPPLRATALILYANWLLATDGPARVRQSVWPVISRDLDYTIQYWNRTGFDLWEEINGSSFFTLSAAHRALVEGAALAKHLDRSCSGCETAAPQILCFLQNFWSPSGFIQSNVNANTSRTGKDANSLISSIHTFDPESSCTDSTFQPCSARALANHKAVVDSFRSIYTINIGRDAGQAVSVGRYAEDVYYEGNPWYLTTLAAAEQLYDALIQWQNVGSITITPLSLPFFSDLLPGIAIGTYFDGSDTFNALVKAVGEYADGFVEIVQHYTPSDGSLSEQFNRDSGVPLSAVHLTWSYAAFVSATNRRAKVAPPSWGESTSNQPPSQCQPAPGCDSTVIFDLIVTTVPGEEIFLTGSLTELQSWAPDHAIPLSASQYTPDHHLWTVTVQLPSATRFEYKYIMKKRDGSISWTGDPNYSRTSPAGCGSRQTFNDKWK